MEFATKVKGTKLIVVMGHTKCGAVSGAIDDAKLGNLTGLVEQIKPVVAKDKDLDTTIKNTMLNLRQNIFWKEVLLFNSW